MSSNLRTLLLVLLAALAGGALLRGVAPVRSDRVAAAAVSVSAVSARGPAGPAVSLALLGGFRALAADLLWLRLYLDWERQDVERCRAGIALVSAVDPRPRVFWINGARMLAYDLPTWRPGVGWAEAPDPRALRPGAREAIRHLAEARRHHPNAAELWLEQGHLEWRRLGDLGAAAESYRRAAECPEAPYHAARLRAEVLRRAGRDAEAWSWLTQLHPRLPPDVEAAAAGTVLLQIRELERRLRIAPERAYREPGPPLLLGRRVSG